MDTNYQTALDTNDRTFSDNGILHVTAIGDASPICGKDDDNFILTHWSDTMNDHDLGASLVASDSVMCGKCSDRFWNY
jgi:hypothetical protein